MSGRSHRVAVLRGDGVGPEVLDAAIAVVEATGVPLEWEPLDWGSDYFHRHGRMAPEDALETARGFDAIFLGAVGDPSIPDHVTLWGLLLPLRQGLDLWANLRPVRLLPGVRGPLADVPPAEIDMLFVRENTEGEYAGVGGRAHRGLPNEVGLETSVFTRGGVERVVRHAFELAAGRRGSLVSTTKSNASRYGYVLWDEVVEAVAADYPGVSCEKVLVDALAARMIASPGSLDVVVASNLFGDVLTDLGAAIQGGMGIAASSSTNPDAGGVGVFEPVHGSAPDIAGKGVANPAGAIWSAALMLEHLGEADAAAAAMKGLEATLGSDRKTTDLGGSAATGEFAAAVAAEVPRYLPQRD